MSIEDIILVAIVLIAAIYVGRRIYLIIFSKKIPKCSGCNGKCTKDVTNTSDKDHDCR